MVKNTQQINEINIYTTAKNYCPLGSDWYSSDIEIRIEPNQFIPNYCSLDDYISAEINGKELIIEDVVKAIYDYVYNRYEPKQLKVIVNVNNAKHSNVRIVKSSEKE